jgi:tRNA (Thr-GGU) A37 N-methylase
MLGARRHEHHRALADLETIDGTPVVDVKPTIDPPA